MVPVFLRANPSSAVRSTAMVLKRRFTTSLGNLRFCQSLSVITWKQLPPKPAEICRRRDPMRASIPIAAATSTA